MVKSVVKIEGKVREFDERWSSLPRFPGLRRFPLGIFDLNFLKGYEHRSIASCLPFVLQGLTASPALKAATDYATWRQLLAKQEYTLLTLQQLRAAGFQLQQSLNALAAFQSASEGGVPEEISGTIKFHKICHWPDYICQFGLPDNYNTETYETMHKPSVKRWIGKVNLSCGSAGSTLLCRDGVSEIHRHHGANHDIFCRTKKRKRIDGETMGRIKEGDYYVCTKIYLECSSCWVGKGWYVMIVRSDNMWEECRIEKIRVAISPPTSSPELLVRLLHPARADDGPIGSIAASRTLAPVTTVRSLENTKIFSILMIMPDYKKAGTYFISPFSDIL